MGRMRIDMNAFNLIDEPWLPVETVDGRHTRMGLRAAFTQAAMIHVLDLDFMPSRISVMRLLIAIRLAADRDRQTANDYLTAWHDRFDLFDPEHPFMQYPNLQPTSLESGRSLSYLLGMFAPNNQRAFTSSWGRSQTGNSILGVSETYRMAPDEAACWVLNAHMYASAGLSTGCIGDPNVKHGKRYGAPSGLLNAKNILLFEQDTLQDTLAMYATQYATNRSDMCAWERDEHTFGVSRPCLGVCDLLTWQARRVRLIPDDTGMIIGSVSTAGDETRDLPWQTDPMIPLRTITIDDTVKPYAVYPNLKRGETENPPLWSILADPKYAKPTVWEHTSRPLHVTSMTLIVNEKKTSLDRIQTDRMTVSRSDAESKRLLASGLDDVCYWLANRYADMIALGGFDSDKLRPKLVARGRRQTLQTINRLLTAEPDASMQRIANRLAHMMIDWRDQFPQRSRYRGADKYTDGAENILLTMLTQTSKETK